MINSVTISTAARLAIEEIDMSMTETTKLRPDMSRKEAVRAFHAMREEFIRVEAERAELQKRIKSVDEVVKIQTSDGNWNYDPYMHGMANGLLVAQAIMHDLHDFTGLSAPDKWLDSRENAQTARAEAGKQTGE